MGYVLVKGGGEAIKNAEAMVGSMRSGGSGTVTTAQVKGRMRLAVDQVMGEGGLYAPDLAALAINQANGDLIEASFLVRAYRSTLPRTGYSENSDTRDMFVLRRISSAFKDIPGGQVLGPTIDYTQRLLDFGEKDGDGEVDQVQMEVQIELQTGKVRDLRQRVLISQNSVRWQISYGKKRCLKMRLPVLMMSLLI